METFGLYQLFLFGDSDIKENQVTCRHIGMQAVSSLQDWLYM